MLTVDELREVLAYDPETGKFTWLVSLAARRAAGTEAGCLSGSDGYPVIRVKTKLYRAHRLAWLWMTGEWPKGDLDHINRNRSDNSWTNLRPATRQENLRNQQAKGYYWHKPNRKWVAQIVVGYKCKYLGSFNTEAEAAVVAREARRDVFGEFLSK